MKTTCYCIYCPRHPKHAKRSRMDCPTGFTVGGMLMASGTGAVVDCLSPVSNAFDEFDIDRTGEVYPVTAYGDGCSITGFERDGIILTATCGNETYEQ